MGMDIFHFNATPERPALDTWLQNDAGVIAEGDMHTFNVSLDYFHSFVQDVTCFDFKESIMIAEHETEYQKALDSNIFQFAFKENFIDTYEEGCSFLCVSI
jgi:hypothetical protein